MDNRKHISSLLPNAILDANIVMKTNPDSFARARVVNHYKATCILLSPLIRAKKAFRGKIGCLPVPDEGSHTSYGDGGQGSKAGMQNYKATCIQVPSLISSVCGR